MNTVLNLSKNPEHHYSNWQDNIHNQHLHGYGMVLYMLVCYSS